MTLAPLHGLHVAHSSPKAWSQQLGTRSGSYRNSNVSINREENNTLEAAVGKPTNSISLNRLILRIKTAASGHIK